MRTLALAPGRSRADTDDFTRINDSDGHDLKVKVFSTNSDLADAQSNAILKQSCCKSHKDHPRHSNRGERLTKYLCALA